MCQSTEQRARAEGTFTAEIAALLYLLYPCSRLWLILPIKKFTAEITEWRFDLSDLYLHYLCVLCDLCG